MKIPLFKSQDIIILTPLDPGLAHKPSPSTFSSSLQLSKDYKKNIFNLTVIKESSMPLKSSNTSIFPVIHYYLNKIETYFIQIQYIIESILNILKNISISKLKLNFNILHFNICPLYVPFDAPEGIFLCLKDRTLD